MKNNSEALQRSRGTCAETLSQASETCGQQVLAAEVVHGKQTITALILPQGSRGVVIGPQIRRLQVRSRTHKVWGRNRPRKWNNGRVWSSKLAGPHQSWGQLI